MSTVNTAFFAGLTQEVTFQMTVLMEALMFTFLGVPFSVCVWSVPAVIILMYIFIWTQGISNIPRVYMSSEYKRLFWATH